MRDYGAGYTASIIACLSHKVQWRRAAYTHISIFAALHPSPLMSLTIMSRRRRTSISITYRLLAYREYFDAAHTAIDAHFAFHLLSNADALRHGARVGKRDGRENYRSILAAIAEYAYGRADISSRGFRRASSQIAASWRPATFLDTAGLLLLRPHFMLPTYMIMAIEISRRLYSFEADVA